MFLTYKTLISVFHHVSPSTRWLCGNAHRKKWKSFAEKGKQLKCFLNEIICFFFISYAALDIRSTYYFTHSYTIESTLHYTTHIIHTHALTVHHIIISLTAHTLFGPFSIHRSLFIFTEICMHILSYYIKFFSPPFPHKFSFLSFIRRRNTRYLSQVAYDGIATFIIYTYSLRTNLFLWISRQKLRWQQFKRYQWIEILSAVHLLPA